MDKRLKSMAKQVRVLTARVDALESREKSATSPPDAESRATPSRAPSLPDAITGEDAFWALTALHARLPDDATTADGAVMLVGSLTLPDGGPVAWQDTAGSAGLLESDWSDSAEAFAALGHPVRLELLRQILNGTHSTGELAAIETLGTTGQLHHHLRQLVTAGWVRQVGRGNYEVAASRIVPLLACLVAVRP